jgi:anti-anti-sigma factor
MLSIRRDGGVVTVRLPADVDAANADSLAEEVAVGVGNESLGVVLDLSPTRYLDSAGVDMLFRLHERMQARRQRLHLVAPQDSPLWHILRIVAMADVMPVHDDLDGAVAAAAGDSAQARGSAAEPG